MVKPKKKFRRWSKESLEKAKKSKTQTILKKLRVEVSKLILTEDAVLLAIDPSSNSVGYAVLDLHTGETIEAGLLVAPAREPVHTRLGLLFEAIQDIKLEYSPEVTAIELIHKRGAHTTLLRAVGAEIAALGGTTLIEVDPLAWQYLLENSDRKDSYEKTDDRDAEEIGRTICQLLKEEGVTV